MAMYVIDQTTKILFSPFYRRVGNPRQKLVRNIKEFAKFIVENNGINDCFVALYSEKYIIDKLFFDLDILDIKIAGKFYKFLESQGFTPIPVFSGSKGFHFYVPLKPERVTDKKCYKRLLRNVSFTLIERSGSYRTDENGRKVSLFDTSVLGDLKRLARVPNTLRPPYNCFWCTYLPQDFYKMKYEELLEYAKSPHNIEYDIVRPCRLSELDFEDDVSFVQETAASVSSISTKIDKMADLILKMLLRPCIYKMLITEEPPHDIRAAATIDLLQIGFSVDDIVELFSRIGWRDWNEDITRYQVTHIAQNHYERYSCRYLMDNGYCVGCDLPYRAISAVRI